MLVPEKWQKVTDTFSNWVYHFSDRSIIDSQQKRNEQIKIFQ